MSAPSKTNNSPPRVVLRRPTSRPRTSFPYVILGAGCAGLSLAWHLVEFGVREPILLIDRRERFENDRTWCFWDVEATPFSDLATHSWPRWLIHDGRREVASECPSYPYLRLRAGDVYQRVLARLSKAPNVTIALGQTIAGVHETPRGLVIDTPDQQYLAGRIFESMGLASRSLAKPRGARLLQHFLGQTVRVNRPAFDPSCPMLMDFRVSQSDGPHFVYVLPLSETEAMVENTYLYPFPIHPDRHGSEIAHYLKARYGLDRDAYDVTAEEAGAIPMAVGTHRYPTGSRIAAIGLAGGAARPSSGYAFLRIQRQVRRIAAAAAAGLDMPTGPVSARKYEVLDAIFLRVLADRPDLAPEIFSKMFQNANPAAVVRFLGEQSSTWDDARIIAALPKWPFLVAALRSAKTFCSS